jgi:uncharacterized protein
VKLNQSFDVAAPLDRVWSALVDVEHVAPCLPGARVTGRNDDGSYNGTLTIKIGPTTASYAGKLEMEQIDEGQHTATMQAAGTDKRGQGGAKATIVSRLVPGEADGTHVDVATDLHITGRLARFGRGGMMEDISERLMKQFAERLQASLTGAVPAGHGGGAAGDGGGAPATEAPAVPTGDAAGAPAGDGTAASEAPAATASEAPAATASEASAAAASEAPAAAASEASAAAASEAPAAAATEVPAAAATEAAAAAAAPAAGAQTAGPASSEHPHHDHRHHHHIEHAEPIEALSLGASVLLARVKRNPARLAVLVGLLVALIFGRRVLRGKRQAAE